METYIQIMLSIGLIIILFVIGFAVYNYEYLKSMTIGGKIRERVVIFKGINDSSFGSDITFDTVDESSSLYRRLSPSYNQTSGIEMTYNFWLFVNPAELYKNIPSNSVRTADAGIVRENIRNQTILFVKGSKRLAKFPSVCGSNQMKQDIMIKCPLVKLEGNGRYLTVEFNTVQNPESMIAGANDVCRTSSSNWELANAHKLSLKSFDDPKFVNKWIMVTIVIQDTYPKDAIPFRNKVRCRIYVNTKLELDKYVDGSIYPDSRDYTILKPNQGHLYFTPKISINDVPLTLPEKTDQLMTAHLTYFNYAITEGEIVDEFNSGVGSEFANIVKDPKKYPVSMRAKKRNFKHLTE